MAIKDNGMGPGKKPAKSAAKAAPKMVTSQMPIKKLERQMTTITKKGDTTYTKYPKRDGMQVTKIMVTKMHPKDTTKKK